MNLDLSFFEPRSIAVIGASNKAGSYASRPLKNLLDRKYAGALYVVNPSATSVSGIPSFSRVGDLPEVPDMVIIAVNAKLAVEALRESGQLGVRNAIILAGGFKEAGNPEGEQELRDIATEFHVAVIGPNCTGMLNVIDNVCASSTLFFREGSELRPGGVSIVAQSGGTGISLLRACADRRIGLGYYLSVGNQACVTAVECANVLLDSPKVRVVALYVEGLGDTGRELLELGAKADRLQKTIVMFKAGISTLGRQLAMTHTGALSGPGDVTPALIKQSGLIYTETHEDLADVMALEACAEFGNRRALSVISTGGGFTVMSADACSKYHVPLATIAPSTSSKMREFVPPFASVEVNPSDITPFDAEGTALAACEVLLEASETDCVILVLGGEDLGRFQTRLASMADKGHEFNTPLVIGLAGVDGFGILKPELKDAVAEAGLPVFSSPVRAIRALSLIGRFDSISSGDAPKSSQSSSESAPSAPSPPPDYLDNLLTSYGVSTPKYVLLRLEDDMESATATMNFPVVAKLLKGDSSSHKSDLGLIQLGVSDALALREVSKEFMARAWKLWTDNEGLSLLVQEQISSDAVEVLVGGVRHAEFGPIVTVGSGGVLTELIRDVAYDLAPLDGERARLLFSRTKIARLVEGYRSDPGFDVEACIGVILAVSRIISDVEELSEIEVNPLMVGRKGAVAVDVRASYR